MHELTLTQTMERTIRGMRRTTITSPFVPEIEQHLKRNVAEQPRLPPMTAAVLDERLHAARQRFEAARKAPDRSLLMTAAELEARSKGESNGFAGATGVSLPGSHVAVSRRNDVRHPRYGRGTVTTVSGGVGRVTVTVLFENDDRCETFVAVSVRCSPLDCDDFRVLINPRDYPWRARFWIAAVFQFWWSPIVRFSAGFQPSGCERFRLDNRGSRPDGKGQLIVDVGRGVSFRRVCRALSSQRNCYKQFGTVELFNCEGHFLKYLFPLTSRPHREPVTCSKNFSAIAAVIRCS